MGKVKGIGGIFFKCQDPDKVKDWYRDNLGLDTDPWGTAFEWRQADEESKGFTQWSPGTKDSKMIGPNQDFMINYRVSDLKELIEELRAKGVRILDEIQEFEYGKFVHIEDVEGKRVELWEPNDEEFDKIVQGRTK